MNIYEIRRIGEILEGNRYPGRGIIAGCTKSGKAAAAYFIMGRSENSRNRIFVEKGGSVFTEPFDAAKVQDPSLIIYAAVRQLGSRLIVTNGNQTDTIIKGLETGGSFEAALRTRAFEPDAPNYTPRISAMLTLAEPYSYEMSILKSADAEGSACNRFFYSYPALPGLGHFLHTYVCDGNPIPTFQGEPERVAVSDDIDAWTEEIWNALDAENRISLYVRFIDLRSHAVESRLINKNGGEK